MYRSRSDKKIAGVCSGVAHYFVIDPTLVRVIWAAAGIFAFAGIVANIVCALVIPEEPEYIDA